MRTIVLISCVSKQLPQRPRAVDLYTSPLFVGALRYSCSLQPDDIYSLSAKYRLLTLDTEFERHGQETAAALSELRHISGGL